MDSAVDVRNTEQNRSVVDEVPRREVVGPIDNQIVAAHDLERVGRRQSRVVKFEANVWIDVVQTVACRIQLRPANGARPVQDLTLQIGKIDVVVINEPYGADSRCRQVQRDGRSESTCPYQQHARRFQTALPILAYLWQQNVPAVAHPFVAVKLAVVNAVVVHVVIYWAVVKSMPRL